MQREAIATSSTIEDAKEKAAGMLGDVAGADIQFDVLELPVKKTLGFFGGSLAKVRAYVSESPADKAVAYLAGVFEKMGLSNVKITVSEKEDGAEISLEGEGLGVVIGRRGETLDALQYLASLACNSEENGFYRIILNTGDYREKREKTLQVLATKMANQAIRTRRNQSLEPMNPYERRIIHTAVQEIDGVSSWSVSDGRNRRVIIGVEKSEGVQKDNNRVDHSADTSHREPRINSGFSSAPVREPKKDTQNTPLYGRIDK